ncbi:mediator complex, subunit Med21 [Lophiotrema nucula]|uniref:Mediator of RNA polymerase II transcription subunit 21 n=1 Tax=Lophiotrema nucula TaxID=690887 RepID=A0A6A5ZRQ6_9PLEO|nr:mediator complex, subunit Med21 [Lophiotrema nucula]
MADVLTQIQDEMDKLLNQMEKSLTYVKERAPPGLIPNQPRLSSLAEHMTQTQQSQSQDQPHSSATQQPPQEDYATDVRELSQDLILKQQQIEILIDRLPGIGTSEKEQVERMKQLERQLEEIEGERAEAVKEKRVLIEKVEGLIRGVGGMG